ncbi:ig-like domain-containing protein [Trichonephila inaurata madagascariensis]|uniref:Ig-like domain-containing protein n=1 Tax=Trichonephila inaurata madagascariensis TaxID=2747483 RepID=A0A8X7C9N0_9ARAC|nr:ig-like domain-containing protein [Trichonephila inaurata madagascariensis]
MKCEVKGRPIPKIRWYKNEAPLEPERGKVDVRKYNSGYGKIGSRLRILHVDIHDTGYYKCEATNDKHSVETTGILMVKAGRMQSPSIIPNFPPPFPHFPALGGR